MILFLDTANLFYGVKMRHNGRLRYHDYMERTASFEQITKIYVYIADVAGRCGPFVEFFEKINVEKVIRIKEPEMYQERLTTEFNVELALDAVQHINEPCCIGSADRRLRPLLQLFKQRPIVHAAGIPLEFKEYSTIVEVSGNAITS